MLAHRSRSAIGAIVLSLVLLCAVAARAEAHPSSASAEQDVRDDSASLLRELAAFPRAKLSAADGIAAVERRIAGSKAVDISFDGRTDRLSYSVKTVRDGKVWEGRIDAATGDIIGSGFTRPLDQFPSDDQRRIADLDAATINLSDAIAIAEKYGSGPAISAGLNSSDGHLSLLVVVVSGGQLKAVSIDPTNLPTAATTRRDLQPVSAQ